MNTESETVTISTDMNETDRLIHVYAVVFQQLLSNEKFNTFFNLNYKMEQTIDDEGNSIMKVVELAPEETQSRLAKKVSELVKEKDKVQLATAADLRKLNAAPKNRTRNKV